MIRRETKKTRQFGFARNAIGLSLNLCRALVALGYSEPFPSRTSLKDFVTKLVFSALAAKKGLRQNEAFTDGVVTLHADPRTIDLWHNSRGGYRAQYYIDPAIGDKANAYALKVIGSVAKQLIQQDNRRKHLWPLACKSIRHPQTRLWIGQGRWFRQRKHTDRVLHLSRWRDHDQTDCKKAAKLMIWGAPRDPEQSSLHSECAG